MRMFRVSISLSIFGVLISGCNLPEGILADAGSGSDHSSSSELSINSHWQFLDNGSVNTTSVGSGVSFTPFNSKLYGIWHEAGPMHVNVGVFSPSSPSQYWTTVGGANGLKWSSSASADAVFGKLAVSNSKLYATWYESDSTNQIRVAVYNGNDLAPAWSFVDGNGPTGLNFNSAMHAFAPTLVSFNSKLYVAWNEATSIGTEAIRVAVYNGNDSSPSWMFVDGNTASGLNYDSFKSASQAQFAVFNSKLYLTWTEGQCFVSAGPCEIRAKVYNGTDSSPSWSSVDGGMGLNVDVSHSGKAPSFAVLSSKLYLGWTEETSSGGSQVRLKVYNGNDSAPAWASIDGNANGLNVDFNSIANGPTFTVFNSQLYGFWEEVPQAGAIYNFQVKVYNGNDSSPSWSALDHTSAPLNCRDGREGSAGQLISFNGSLFAGWSEQCPRDEMIRFAKHL